jgi:urease subunit alpha
MVSWAPLGTGNAATMFVEPRMYRPRFGGLGGAPERLSCLFVSQAAAGHVGQRTGTHRRIAPVRNTRSITKRDMVRNAALPEITVDPDTYTVRVDGAVATCEPAETVPLGQLYFIG